MRFKIGDLFAAQHEAEFERNERRADAFEQELEEMHEDGTLETLVGILRGDFVDAFLTNDYTEVHAQMQQRVASVISNRRRLKRQFAEEDEAERRAQARAEEQAAGFY